MDRKLKVGDRWPFGPGHPKNVPYVLAGCSCAYCVSQMGPMCECGDPKADHENGTGECIHNKPQDLTHGYKDCLAFRPAKR